MTPQSQDDHLIARGRTMALALLTAARSLRPDDELSAHRCRIGVVRAIGDAPVWQLLCMASWLVRKIAGRYGNGDVTDRTEDDGTAIDFIDTARDSIRHMEIHGTLTHREAGLQRRVLELANPRVAPPIAAGIAERYCQDAPGIEPLEVIELAVHLVQWCASLHPSGADALLYQLSAELIEDQLKREGVGR